MKRSLLPTILAVVFLHGTIFNHLEAQDIHDSLFSLNISIPTVRVSDPDEINLKIVIRNISKNEVKVYHYLAEGYRGDNSKNLYLVVEKKTGDKFRTYKRGAFYQLAPGEDSDYIPKITILPNDTVVFYYHVTNSYGFRPGNYRLKCFYNKSMLKKEYVSSNWIYFDVAKYVPIKLHHDELLQKAVWPDLKEDSVKQPN